MADAHPARLQLPLPSAVSANRARRLLGLAPREALVAAGVATGFLATAGALAAGTDTDASRVALQRAGAMARLDALARRDSLTGLPNRRLWDEELPRLLSRARVHAAPICVAMLDLDRFKEYNDAHGHAAGDRLLRAASAAWADVLREHDLLVRYGGEEFALVLADCDADDAVPILERLRAVMPEGQTCSAGLAQWDLDEAPAELVERADHALYAAKRSGRDRMVVAPSGDDSRSAA